MKTELTPRYRLTHLITHLRRGDGIRIAIAAHLSPSYVSAVLNGKTNQQSARAKNIIRIAENYARQSRYYRK